MKNFCVCTTIVSLQIQICFMECSCIYCFVFIIKSDCFLKNWLADYCNWHSVCFRGASNPAKEVRLLHIYAVSFPLVRPVMVTQGTHGSTYLRLESIEHAHKLGIWILTEETAVHKWSMFCDGRTVFYKTDGSPSIDLRWCISC